MSLIKDELNQTSDDELTTFTDGLDVSTQDVQQPGRNNDDGSDSVTMDMSQHRLYK